MLTYSTVLMIILIFFNSRGVQIEIVCFLQQPENNRTIYPSQLWNWKQFCLSPKLSKIINLWKQTRQLFPHLFAVGHLFSFLPSVFSFSSCTTQSQFLYLYGWKVLLWWVKVTLEGDIEDIYSFAISESIYWMTKWLQDLSRISKQPQSTVPHSIVWLAYTTSLHIYLLRVIQCFFFWQHVAVFKERMAERQYLFSVRDFTQCRCIWN